MSQPYIGQIILVPYNFAPLGYAFCDGSLLPIDGNDVLFQLIGTTYGGDGVLTFALPDLRSRLPIHMGQGSGLQSYTIGQTGGTEAVTLTVNQIPAHTHVVDLSPLTATARCKNGVGNQQTPVNNVPAIEGTAPYTDDPLVAGSSTVRAVHITELRTRVDGVRARYGLPAFNYSDPVLTQAATLVTAQHVLDLRMALGQAFAAALRPAPTYTDPGLGPGTAIKAAHISELRAAAIAATYSTLAPDSAMNAGGVTIGGALTAAASGGSGPHDNLQPYLTFNFCISLFGIFPSQV